MIHVVWMSVRGRYIVVIRVIVEILHLAIFRRRVHDIAREQLLIIQLLVVVCNLLILKEIKLIPGTVV